MNKKMNIKPFHLFEHQGCRCVINIEDMRAQSIDESTARTLEELNAESDATLQSGVEEHLRKLDLIADDGGEAKKVIRKKPVPIVDMTLFLTQSCNLNCTYCFGKGGAYGSGGSLEERTAYRAVDWLIERSGKRKKIHVSFFGGEPFLKFPMMKAVTKYAQRRARAVNKAISFSVTTNATLLGDEEIAFVRDNDVSVMVSFDGPREIQDAQRPFADGKGSYDVALPKIKKLLEKCPESHAHAVITGHTDPYWVRNVLLEIGFTEIAVVPASASLFDEGSGASDPDTDSSVFGLMEQEAKSWIEYTKKRDRPSLKRLMSNSELHQGLLSFVHNTKRRYPCGAGLWTVGVSCAGGVYLCHRFVGADAYKLGNVFDDTLDREKYHQSPLTFVEACRKCFARYCCAGGCKHHNAGSCGSVFKPSEDICRLRRRETELAAYVACFLTDQDRAFLAEYKIIPPKRCSLDFG